MISTGYLASANGDVNSKTVTSSRKFSYALISAILIVMFAFSGAMGAIQLQEERQQRAEAVEGFELGKWFYCSLLGQTFMKDIYRWSNGNDDEFFWFSRSSVSKGSDDVTRGLNWLLDLKGNNFITVNESVLGRTLNELRPDNQTASATSSATSTPSGTASPTPSKSASPSPSVSSSPTTSPTTSPTGTTANANYNKGPQVSPFDRFGVAGLNFTSYLGEWRYMKINPCEAAEPEDPKAGLYYEGRLFPMTMWDDQDQSKDIRTKQHSTLVITQINHAFVNTFANWIFSLTKLIVVLCVALVEFAFSDLVTVMGLNGIIAGDGSQGSGIFNQLYKGIFQPLIVIAFFLVGCNLAWVGLIKREYRKGITTVARSFFIYVCAIIAFMNAAFIVSLPNTIAVLGQSLIVTALAPQVNGTKGGLCQTNVGEIQQKAAEDAAQAEKSAANKNIAGGDGVVGGVKNTVTKAASNSFTSKPLADMEKVAQNARASIGCTFWEMFLLKPWSQGQFGVDWNDTWAKDGASAWAQDPIEFQNSEANAAFVGDAEVPVGNGEFIKNWAIFQISTETNVHAPIKGNGVQSRQTAGLANDWWRIVDVVSNYSENEKTAKVAAAQKGGAATEQKYVEPTADPPLTVWDNWTGNSPLYRFFVACSSVLVALIGVLVPMIFALLSASYSVILALMMAFTPVMLLMACIPGRGWDIFASWGQGVLNLIVKRIVVGALMALSLVFTSIAIDIMMEENWWKGIIMMTVLSYVLFASRSKLIDVFSFFRFARVDLASTGKRLQSNVAGVAKGVAQTGAGTVYGGAKAKQAGGSFKEGMLAAGKSELRNHSRRSKLALRTLESFDAHRAEDGYITNDMLKCAQCYKEIVKNGPTTIATFNGKYYCDTCVSLGDVPEGATEEVIDFSKANARRQEQENARLGRDARRKLVSNNTEEEDESLLESHQTNHIRRPIIDALKENATKNDGRGTMSDEELYRALAAVASGAEEDIARFKYVGRVNFQIPDELKKYLPENTVQVGLEGGLNEGVAQAYRIAWAAWAADNLGKTFAKDRDQIITKLNEAIAKLAAEDIPDAVDEEERTS